MHKQTIHLPPLLLKHIVNDDYDYLKSLYDNGNMSKIYRQFFSSSIITFYCAKHNAKKCLNYMLTEHPEHTQNYKNLFKIVIREEYHTGFYHGLNAFNEIHKKDNNYYELLWGQEFNSCLFKLASLNKKEPFTHLLNSSPTKFLVSNKNVSLLEVLFNHKSWACLKVYIDSIINETPEELYKLLIKPTQNENLFSFWHTLCNASSEIESLTKKTSPSGPKLKAINSIQKDIYYLQPIIEKICTNKLLHSTLMYIAIKSGSPTIVNFMPIPTINYTYIQDQFAYHLFGRDLKDSHYISIEKNCIHNNVITPNSFTPLKKLYPSNYHFFDTKTNKYIINEDNAVYHNFFSFFHYDQYALFLDYFTKNSDMTKKDALGNTNLHILCLSLTIKNLSSDSKNKYNYENKLEFLSNYFNQNPELFLIKNKNNKTPIDIIVKEFIKDNSTLGILAKEKQKLFIKNLSTYQEYKYLEDKITIKDTNKKTTLKI